MQTPLLPGLDMQTELLVIQLDKAATDFDLDLFGDAVVELLWSLVESRSDMDEFPSEVAKLEGRIKKGFQSCLFEDATLAVREVFENGIMTFLAGDDRVRIDSIISKIQADAESFDLVAVADGFHVLSAQLAMVRGNTKKLPLMIEDGVIHAGRHTTISFNRTLRVPEDGKDYPLPAGFGTLPIYRVEDYADKVPSKWLDEGGFFIPLYQREALYIEFGGESWRPTIAKIAVGRVNAVSGKSFTEQLSSTEQDYVVIPDQQWLDGINSAQGSVSQFVAMPLGQGYTVEEQVTDEAKHGGFQIMICDPKSERFPDNDPEETDAQKDAAAERRRLAKQRALIETMPEPQRSVGLVYLQKWATADEICIPTISMRQHWAHLCAVAEAIHTRLGDHDCHGFDPGSLEQYKERLESVYALPDGNMLAANERPILNATDSSSGVLASAARPSWHGSEYLFAAPVLRNEDIEMGIAAGGRITQNIVGDEHGVESWDISTRVMLNIHIVNSEHFHRITGLPAPPTPITKEAYEQQRIPWFTAYDELKPAISPATAFQFIKGIATLDKLRGHQKPDDVIPMVVTPALIKRIHTPSRDERVNDLERRIEASWSAGRHLIAHREATLLLDLEWRHQRALHIRAECNLALGRYDEADADASEWLEYWGDDPDLRAVRASANLRIGAFDMAREDASSAITSSPEHSGCLQVRAEANLCIGKCGDAWSDLQCLLRLDPSNLEAVKLRAECYRQQGSFVRAIQDATHVLIKSGADARTLEIRADAYLSAGNPFDARRDAEQALSLMPSSTMANHVIAQLPANHRR